jgi:hypothetical protein
MVGGQDLDLSKSLNCFMEPVKIGKCGCWFHAHQNRRCTIGQLVIIAGPSGMGKSTSFRNMDPKDTLLIKAVSKPLPFPEKKLGWKVIDQEGQGNIFVTDNPGTIKALMSKAPSKGFKNIIIDDATFTMTNEFMRRISEKNFDKWSDLAYNVWSLVNTVRELPDDVIVWLVWHVEETNRGAIKLRTVGKLTDEKIDIPALATVVLIAERNSDGEYVFRTQNSGMDIAKSPVGMFDEEFIPNDLKMVEQKIREYYGE